MMPTVRRMMAPNAIPKTPKPENVNGLGEPWDPNHPAFRGVDLVNIRQLINEVTN